MPSSGLKGSFPLTNETIDDQITITAAGNYALGYEKDGAFYIDYVGRSDTDLNRRLRDWVGHYNRFKFDYAPSANAAFLKECELYHDFNPKDNKVHPARPEGSNWKYPCCQQFG